MFCKHLDMSFHRCCYLFPEALTVIVLRKRMLQSCGINVRGDCRSKKKCITGLWDLNIPSDLLQNILSRLGLKANIQASAVCKAWCEAAVSVRKLLPRPWLLYPLEERCFTGIYRRTTDQDTPTGSYILFDPLRGQSYKQVFPELGPVGHEFSYYKDGWLLVLAQGFPKPDLLFFLNPFTRECIYLPMGARYCLAFSAAPTSTSCLVISFDYQDFWSDTVIKTWRPGQTLWTTHCFENQLPGCQWNNCLFSNGMFYCLSTCGHLGVFDPPRATWTILPVKPCLPLCQPDLVRRYKGDLVRRRVLMMEHEGDVFAISMSIHSNNKPLVFKLNLKCNVWEEKRQLGGLTVFTSHPASLTRAGLSVQERNRIYSSFDARPGVYYSFPDDYCHPAVNYLSNRIAWVDPPLNQLNLSRYYGLFA